jgi:Na+/H+ antiporter NhaA
MPPHGSYGELVTNHSRSKAMTLTTDSRFATAVLALAALAAVLAVFLVGMAIVDASTGHHIAGITTTPTGPHA